MHRVKHISVTIGCSPDKIYEFVTNPTNLPKWAEGLSKSLVIKSGEDWICDSPMGIVKVKFAQRNDFGVMDHIVTLPNGESVNNSFRVLKNEKGSEVVFTIFHLPSLSEEQFMTDVEQIQKDLLRLKEIMEK